MPNHSTKQKRETAPINRRATKAKSTTPINRQATEPCNDVAARPFRLCSEEKFVIPRLRDMGAVQNAYNADKSAGYRTKQVPQNRILAIETSGSTFSLALAEGDGLISEVFWYSGLTHSERLIPALDHLLSDAGWKLEEISTIAVSTGPGSFTGIRVGLSCARTLAQTLSLPLAGMTTLDLLSAAVPAGPYRVVPIIDALRGEVFTIDDHKEAVITSIPGMKNILKKQKGMFMFAGNAVHIYQKEIKKLFGKKALFANSYLNSPRAGVLALSAKELPVHPYTRIHPLYIRRSWAEEKQRNP